MSAKIRVRRFFSAVTISAIFSLFALVYVIEKENAWPVVKAFVQKEFHFEFDVRTPQAETARIEDKNDSSNESNATIAESMLGQGAVAVHEATTSDEPVVEEIVVPQAKTAKKKTVRHRVRRPVQLGRIVEKIRRVEKLPDVFDLDDARFIAMSEQIEQIAASMEERLPTLVSEAAIQWMDPTRPLEVVVTTDTEVVANLTDENTPSSQVEVKDEQIIVAEVPAEQPQTPGPTLANFARDYVKDIALNIVPEANAQPSLAAEKPTPVKPSLLASQKPVSIPAPVHLPVVELPQGESVNMDHVRKAAQSVVDGNLAILQEPPPQPLASTSGLSAPIQPERESSALKAEAPQASPKTEQPKDTHSVAPTSQVSRKVARVAPTQASSREYSKPTQLPVRAPAVDPPALPLKSMPLPEVPRDVTDIHDDIPQLKPDIPAEEEHLPRYDSSEELAEETSPELATRRFRDGVGDEVVPEPTRLVAAASPPGHPTLDPTSTRVVTDVGRQVISTQAAPSNTVPANTNGQQSTNTPAPSGNPSRGGDTPVKVVDPTRLGGARRAGNQVGGEQNIADPNTVSLPPVAKKFSPTVTTPLASQNIADPNTVSLAPVASQKVALPVKPAPVRDLTRETMLALKGDAVRSEKPVMGGVPGSVHVYDLYERKDTHPIQGAELYVFGTSEREVTGADGIAKMNSLPELGQWRVRAEAPGFWPTVFDLEPKPGQAEAGMLSEVVLQNLARAVNVDLDPSLGVVIGTVRDKLGNPVEGVSVKMMGSAKAEPYYFSSVIPNRQNLGTTTTGMYVFFNVEPISIETAAPMLVTIVPDREGLTTAELEVLPHHVHQVEHREATTNIQTLSFGEVTSMSPGGVHRETSLKEVEVSGIGRPRVKKGFLKDEIAIDVERKENQTLRVAAEGAVSLWVHLDQIQKSLPHVPLISKQMFAEWFTRAGIEKQTGTGHVLLTVSSWWLGRNVRTIHLDSPSNLSRATENIVYFDDQGQPSPVQTEFSQQALSTAIFNLPPGEHTIAIADHANRVIKTVNVRVGPGRLTWIHI